MFRPLFRQLTRHDRESIPTAYFWLQVLIIAEFLTEQWVFFVEEAWQIILPWRADLVIGPVAGVAFCFPRARRA